MQKQIQKSAAWILREKMNTELNGKISSDQNVYFYILIGI